MSTGHSQESAYQREPKLGKSPSDLPIGKPTGVFLAYVRTHLPHCAQCHPWAGAPGVYAKATYAGQKDKTGKPCSSRASASVLP